MSQQHYHLAQINIAHIVAPTDSPIMAEFMENLDRINALAEQSPGFVWRLKDDNNNATSIRPFEDDTLLVNMSVWETPEALFEFTYKTAHTDYLRRRAEWFKKSTLPVLTMWWVPVGTAPTLLDAKEKIHYLAEHGPTPLAFTFKPRFTVGEMLALVSQ